MVKNSASRVQRLNKFNLAGSRLTKLLVQSLPSFGSNAWTTNQYSGCVCGIDCKHIHLMVPSLLLLLINKPCKTWLLVILL